MAPAAAYDEIADWYEDEFLARTAAAGADVLASSMPCGSSWARAAASAWRSAAAPGCAPHRSGRWAGALWAWTCPPECSGMPGTAFA